MASAEIRKAVDKDLQDGENGGRRFHAHAIRQRPALQRGDLTLAALKPSLTAELKKHQGYRQALITDCRDPFHLRAKLRLFADMMRVHG